VVTLPESPVTIPGIARKALDFFNCLRHLRCFR
jgi:hypothetical protein